MIINLDGKGGGGIANETDPIWTGDKTQYYTKTEVDGKTIIKLTQAEYDALGEDYDSTKLYLITDAD